MEVHLRVLELGLTVSGPADCVEPISFAYRAFRDDSVRGVAWVRWNGRCVETDRGVYPGVDGVAPLEQLYPRFLDRLHDGLGEHALIHAGVVADGKRAVLLAGPSGHGKSTLSLELATRGWTLYSDDFAPVSLDDGMVRAFPRAVGIVPGAAVTPAVFEAAAERSRHAMFGKRLVHAGDIARCAEHDSTPLPIGDLFLLRGGALPAPRLEVSCVPDEADRIAGLLSEIAGDAAIDRVRTGALQTIGVEMPPGAMSPEALSDLLLDPAVVYSSKYWSRRPSWQGETSCSPVLRLKAAQWLARELLNRRPGGALLERYGGDTVSLVIELAAALKSTRCWMLTPGTLARTADKIEAIAGTPPQ